MNLNILKWVKALESNKYEQGYSYLARNDKYCCLGVACEVAIENGIQLSVKGSDVKHYNGNSVCLPEEVSDWLGVSDEETSEYMLLNDGYHSPFATIAQVIRDKHAT